MKYLRILFSFLVPVVLIFCLPGCHLLRDQVTDSTPALNNLSRSATENALIGVNNQVKPLQETLVNNIILAVKNLDPVVKAELKGIMDTVGNLSAAQIRTIGLSIDSQIINVKGQVEDKQLINFFLNALDAAIGKVDSDGRKAISDILQSTLDSLNSKSTQAKIHILINTLIGDTTQKQINDFTKATITPVLNDFFTKIDKLENKTSDLVTHILVTSAIALFLGLILFLVMRNKLKTREKVIDSVSMSIHELKEQHAAIYDNLTKSIKKRTLLQGVEPYFRENLEKKGIQKPKDFKA